MSDDKISEIYLYAIHARNNGQDKIPVYIFPSWMNEKNFCRYSLEYVFNQDLIQFWQNLKVGYYSFIEEKVKLYLSINN